MIDICLVAGRRPGLLELTLDSFEKLAFRNFDIGRALVNIDDIFGTSDDEAKCIELIQDYLPGAEIVTSGQANFTAAVKNLWARSSSEYIFHLEDDWIIHEKIDQKLFRMFDGVTKQLCFICIEKKWDGQTLFSQRFKKMKFCGITFSKKPMPRFSTSPSIIDGRFARNCADLMDLNYNPEKQFGRSLNLQLEEYVRPFRSRLVSGKYKNNLISDIGRTWCKQQGIQKLKLESQNIGIENYSFGHLPNVETTRL